MGLIELQNVAKTYPGPRGGIVALHDISLKINAGEFVAVIGPSGSGKSTLLTVLGAMNPPTSGKVIVDGIDIYDLSNDRQADFRRAYLGFVFQQQHLIQHLSAMENVMLPLVVTPMNGSKKERARQSLLEVGLADRELHLPGQLSGGEQGRVAIARAIVNDPPIILADEPTGNLDSQTGREILGLLMALNKRGRTIIMVTHNDEAWSLASRVVTIRDRVIVADEERCGH